MEEETIIEQKELDEINILEDGINRLKLIIGDLEVQKQTNLIELQNISNKLNAYQMQLFAKYKLQLGGNYSIDSKTRKVSLI